MPKQFRFNASRVFLTYSQTPKRFSSEVVLRKISEKAGVEEYLISQERHSDGGYHIYGYFKFTEKLDTRATDYFDLEYYRQGYHPNIQKVTKVWKLWDYIKKDKQYITNIVETRPTWLRILEDSNDLEEALTSIMWSVGRIDNYAGYRTLRDLLDMKTWKISPEKYLAKLGAVDPDALERLK